MSITEKSTKKPRISAAAKRQNEEARNRAESSEYLTTKKHIVAREKDNYVKLAFVKDKNGWYKGFDHTAVIFACDLAPKIGMKVRLLPDRDYNNPAEYGIVSIPDMEKVASLLAGLGIKKEYDRGGTVVFRLKEKYTEDDIERMLEDEKALVEKANKLVLPKEVMPALKNRLQALARSIFETVRKMPAPAREVFGAKMSNRACGLLKDFFLMANSDIDKKDYFMQAEATLDEINGWLMTALNIGALPPKKVIRIMEFLNSARTQLAAEIKKADKDGKTIKRRPTAGS